MTLAVSVAAGGVTGAEATEGSGVELGVEAVEVEVGSGFSGAGLGVVDCVLATDGVARGAGTAAGLLELVLAVVFGVGFTLAVSTPTLGATGLASATLAGVWVAVLEEASTGAEVLGAAVLASAVIAGFVAGSGTAISLSLRV